MSNSISLEKMYEILGVAKPGSRYDIAYLCSNEHGKINKWARHKPERINSIVPIADNQRQINNFGLRPGKIYNGKNSALDALRNGEVEDWVYEAPRADVDFLRLSDLDGYDHGATSPFGSLRNPTSKPSDMNGVVSLDMPVIMPLQDENAINMKEFSLPNYEFKDWYPGVMMLKGDYSFIGTSAQKFSELDDYSAGWVINLGKTSNLGTYKGAIFISSQPFDTDGVENAGTRICFVGKPVDILLTGYVSPIGVGINAKCYIGSDTTLVPARFVIRFYNESQTERTFTKMFLLVATDSVGSGQTNLNVFGDNEKITVPGESDITREITVNLAQKGLPGPATSYRFFKVTADQYKTDWIYMADDITTKPDFPVTPNA